jgi:hypothetical protein
VQQIVHLSRCLNVVEEAQEVWGRTSDACVPHSYVSNSTERPEGIIN